MYTDSERLKRRLISYYGLNGKKIPNIIRGDEPVWIMFEKVRKYMDMRLRCSYFLDFLVLLGLIIYIF